MVEVKPDKLIVQYYKTRKYIPKSVTKVFINNNDLRRESTESNNMKKEKPMNDLRPDQIHQLVKDGLTEPQVPARDIRQQDKLKGIPLVKMSSLRPNINLV